ncbi:MAG: beta-N-acetylhexosaminidase [Prevotellaceae bacterium]|jgi:hexosaminidase|nr:beta-N-acetylhexosaminidase [Prevotellaceae bacterium]
MIKKILLFGCAVLCTANLFAQRAKAVNIIPLPEKYTLQSGEFVVNAQTKIVLNANGNAQAQYAVERLNEQLKAAAGFSLPVATSGAGANTITCTLNPNLKNDEAYKLSVTKSAIRVEAKTPRGIFYAMQTIRQLLPVQIESKQQVAGVKWTIPCIEVEDAPRYSYRGLHLDVSRHFMSKDEVMQYIDLLAYHKMNTFHWHLTEDQGWRIEIKQYPKLTEVGAYRNRTLKGAYVAADKRQWDNTRYGGFYTQDEVKEVLAYAEKRFVTVIPEIELPGHAVAALTAYPQYSCTGGPFEVEGLWGVFNDIFCPKEETFTFLENILTEVADLFPSEYIHIGGDEAPKTRWSRCHACQEKIKKEGLKDEHELQSYFVTRIEKFLATKGKKIIGWDEILEGGITPSATIMHWRSWGGSDTVVANAIRRGNKVIMTPSSHAYLDYYQANPKTEPHAIGGYLPIWKVYAYEPTLPGLTTEESKRVLGFQGNVWTEYMPNFGHVLYMAYPRAAAIAEVGWTPKAKRSYDDFQDRLIQLMTRYDVMGIRYNRTFLSEGRIVEKK